jgi:hypothetical protein
MDLFEVISYISYILIYLIIPYYTLLYLIVPYCTLFIIIHLVCPRSGVINLITYLSGCYFPPLSLERNQQSPLQCRGGSLWIAG